MEQNEITSFDKDISMEIKEDEELLWRGKPQKASFVLSKSVKLLPIALLWLCLDGSIISMIFSSKISTVMYIFLIVFFALHLMPVWIWVGSIIKALKNHKDIEYAFTNERIIIRNKYYIKSYYYNTLNSTSVSIGFIDKLFKVGDISISGMKSLKLLDIDNPYAVSGKLQQFIDTAQKKEKQRIEAIQEQTENYDDNNEFEQSIINFKGRFTSKKAPTLQTNNEEDEYLDEIIDSIDNGKQDFKNSP